MTNNSVEKLEIAVETEKTMFNNNLEDTMLPVIIQSAIDQKQCNKPNLPLEEKQALKNLKENSNLLILKSDKGNQLVLMDKTDYQSKLEKIIYSGDYTKLNQNPSNKIDSDLRKIVGKIGDKVKKEEKLFEKIICHYNREPSIFANPKIHKPENPLRPIISSFNTVLSNAAKFVTPILENIHNNQPGTKLDIQNIYEAKCKLIENEDTENNVFCLFSLDVVNMFGNIQPKKAYDVIKQLTENDQNFKSFSSINKNTFLEILNLILDNSYFEYKSDYYKQTKGLPMGSPTSPAIAKIYMQALEQKWKEVPNFNLSKGLLRYMDDYFGKWYGKEEELKEFVNQINNTDEDIKFTLEQEKNYAISFLDAKITRLGRSLQFRTQTKDFASDAILPADSFQDSQIKNSLIEGETLRVLRISDDPEADLEILKNRLIRNKYNPKHISRLFLKVKNNYKQWTTKGKPEAGEKNSQQPNPQKNPFLCLKFMGKTTKKLKKNLKKVNVKLVHKKQMSLECYFSHKHKYKTMNNKGIIYQVFCSCGQYYIGETSFDFETRKYWHCRDILACNSSNSLALHVNYTSHKICWEDSKILGFEGDKIKRKLKEGIFIKEMKPQLNMSSGFKIKGSWKLEDKITQGIGSVKKQEYEFGIKESEKNTNLKMTENINPKRSGTNKAMENEMPPKPQLRRSNRLKERNLIP